MPKKKEPPLSAAEQRRRFEALAHEVEARAPDTERLRKLVGKVALAKGRPLARKK